MANTPLILAVRTHIEQIVLPFRAQKAPSHSHHLTHNRFRVLL